MENLTSYLESIGVCYYAMYAGDTDVDGITMDEWNIKFTRKQVGTSKLQTKFYTGVGLRALNNHRDYKCMVKLPYNDRAKFIASNGRPIHPMVENVLESLLLDAEYTNGYSFDDWCYCLGYDNDSMKAFTTYKKCLSISKNLHKFFSSEELKQISIFVNGEESENESE